MVVSFLSRMGQNIGSMCLLMSCYIRFGWIFLRGFPPPYISNQENAWSWLERRIVVRDQPVRLIIWANFLVKHLDLEKLL
jgi:hypothetical protein